MMITEHFSSREFAQPTRHGFGGRSYPSDWLSSRLRPLCVILETLRGEFNRPITITSGWRSWEYNRAIGGARRSQHPEGRAADIKVRGIPAKRVHAALLRLHQEGRIRLGGLGAYPTFTHVDIRPSRSVRLARWGGSRRTA